MAIDENKIVKMVKVVNGKIKRKKSVISIEHLKIKQKQ